MARPSLTLSSRLMPRLGRTEGRGWRQWWSSCHREGTQLPESRTLVSTSDSGASFTVTVGNSTGSVTSNAATLSVTAAPVAPSITTQPVSKSVIAGQTAGFTIAATGTAPLTYQWTKNGIAMSGATSASYTTPATTVSDNGASFTVTVSDTAGSTTSNAATSLSRPRQWLRRLQRSRSA